MKKILCLVIGVLLISLSEAQNKGTQDQRVMEDRSRGPVSHQGGQFPGRSKLEPMPVLALPISPIRLSFGQNVLDLRDYMVNYDAISQVMLDGKRIEQKGRFVNISAPLSKPIQVLQLVSLGETLEIPVFNTDKSVFTFTYKASSPAVKSVFLAGSFNGWNNSATELKKLGDGSWTIQLELNQGEHAYRIWEDGKEMLDANNTLRRDNGLGGENNYFVVGQVNKSNSFITSELIEGKKVILHVHGRVDDIMVFYNNNVIQSVERKDHIIKIELPNAPAEGFLRVYATEGNQRLNDVLVPIHQGVALLNDRFLPRQDHHAQIMYFMMVDRFSDGIADNNFPTNDPDILPKANTMGGDLKGIEEKINQSYFTQLGVNTIWISPICKNVEGAWGLWDKGVKSKFSAYHGYWPIALTKIDKRFGTERDLDSLIHTAHKRQINVVLDYVAHHVHQDHALIKKKKNWTTPLYLPDGTMNTERWDDHRLTTWFDTFLPTFDFARPEVINALSDTALYWIRRFPIDGFRHDATKHIATDFWKELTFKIKRERKFSPLFQIGETYGSPELISSYVSNGMLDAQFDFNLYDAAVDAFAKDHTDFQNLDRVMKESFRYYGSHHLMGNITGNQDRARFISYADGSIQFEEDAKLAGWTKDIKNRGTAGYRKLEQLMAFVMTTPGVPCIYYGDEIGMPGGNDPDNRRLMQFDQLNMEQRKLKSSVARLTHLRRQHLALTYGDTHVLRNDSVFAYVRKYFGDLVLVVFDKSDRNPKDSVWISLNILPEWGFKNLKAEMGSAFKLEGNKWMVNLSGKGYDVFTTVSSREDQRRNKKPEPSNQERKEIAKPDKLNATPKGNTASPQGGQRPKPSEAAPVPNRKPDEQ